MDPVKIAGIAKKIKDDSKRFLDDYWERKTKVKDVKKKREPFDDLYQELKKVYDTNDGESTSETERGETEKPEIEKIREVLDAVARQNMSTYYNMLLPKTVLYLILL